jgi:hypothetical protein
MSTPASNKHEICGTHMANPDSWELLLALCQELGQTSQLAGGEPALLRHVTGWIGLFTERHPGDVRRIITELGHSSYPVLARAAGRIALNELRRDPPVLYHPDLITMVARQLEQPDGTDRILVEAGANLPPLDTLQSDVWNNIINKGGGPPPIGLEALGRLVTSFNAGLRPTQEATS